MEGVVNRNWPRHGKALHGFRIAEWLSTRPDLAFGRDLPIGRLVGITQRDPQQQGVLGSGSIAGESQALDHRALQSGRQMTIVSKDSSAAARPMLSVVCINKNNEDTIEQAIRSVLSQTVENMEFVMADGGSTDSSLDIIGKYPEIRLVDGVDTSRGDGVLRAVRAARGKYIAFMTSTDGYLGPNWLQTAVDHLESDPEASLVWGAAISMDTKGQLVPRFFPKAFPAHRKVAQKKDWFPIWMVDSGVRLSYFPELSYVVRADIYQRLIEPDPACPELENIDPILRFHFEFNRNGYLPVYMPSLAYFGRTHDNQGQFSDAAPGWIANYDRARKKHVARLLSGETTHVWRDGNGREIGRMDAGAAKRAFFFGRILHSRLLRSVRKRIGL
ncbi:glycosyltransferase [Breoghania sp. L-A4]|uniref:glycosyltransferase n=1 Tax=Breoghania sp. L-A4 TaxID=2304600 RepID=UPI0013C33B0D|nr:glycosyltransferase [Breoghania sp. L-A4]